MEFLLNLPNSKLKTYRKYLQKMYKIIKDLDSQAIIIKYKMTDIESNQYRHGVKAKEVLLNFSEVIPKYLTYIYDYFPNGYPNKKRLYSKFQILYNEDIEKIILAVKEDDRFIETKF